MLQDVTAKNYGTMIPTIVRRVNKGVRGLLAQDADIADLAELLDALEDSSAMEGVDSEEEDPNVAGSMSEHMEGMDDSGIVDKIKELVKGHVPPEMMAKIDEIAGEENRIRQNMSEDAEYDDAYDAACQELGRDETPEETEAREEKMSADRARDKMGRDETEEEAMDRRARDKAARDRRRARDAARDKAARDKLGRDESPEESQSRRMSERAADRKRLGRDEPPPFKGRPNPGGTMDTKNMVTKDEARKMAQDAITEERKTQQGIREALTFVQPWVGNLTMAFDSADAVYKHALDARGVKTDGVDASAFKTILGLTPKPNSQHENPASHLANDAKPIGSFGERFKSAGRISHM